MLKPHCCARFYNPWLRFGMVSSHFLTCIIALGDEYGCNAIEPPKQVLFWGPLLHHESRPQSVKAHCRPSPFAARKRPSEVDPVSGPPPGHLPTQCVAVLVWAMLHLYLPLHSALQTQPRISATRAGRGLTLAGYVSDISQG